MTQIELLPCPFCGNSPSSWEHVWRGTLVTCFRGGCPAHSNTVSPNEWNTRSDTREQAAASPSAVGEGQPQPFAFYDKNENRFWEASDNSRDYLSPFPEIVELYTRPQMDALSSQAPKPASAGGEPIPMVLHCPECFLPHLDVGEWATRPHKTHRCANCGYEWRPANVPTVGVESLPAIAAEADTDKDGAK